ncbi:hypothetical protein EDB85DRAFT_1969722 [Lactarius pseudohatsudake]|nr:hypothetical protein EDB85DRAFT_1969722 [Lactarius pseudohatsudake]
MVKQDKCVIYSFCINGESSFESTLLKRAPRCEVWGYDYSVNSVRALSSSLSSLPPLPAELDM